MLSSVTSAHRYLLALLFALPPPAFAQEPPRPPLLNRANEQLPGWLRVRGEFRERVEGFDGLGFDDDREDLYFT
jgi:hypothetical protein